jgi:hypothetical protein
MADVVARQHTLAGHCATSRHREASSSPRSVGAGRPTPALT